MILGNNFIIFSILILLPLIPVYFYKEYLFKSYYKRTGVEAMVSDLKICLKNDFPKITFNYDIVNKSAIIEDLKEREASIIEDLIIQFAIFSYSAKTQTVVPKNELWSNYDQNCRPISKKSPSDLSQRKELALKRNKHRCDRCGKKLSLKTANLLFINPLSNGGSYSLENITVLCHDCQRLLSNTKPQEIALDLELADILFKKSLANSK